jgi:hypothetical protein
MQDEWRTPNAQRFSCRTPREWGGDYRLEARASEAPPIALVRRFAVSDLTRLRLTISSRGIPVSRCVRSIAALIYMTSVDRSSPATSFLLRGSRGYRLLLPA